MTFDDVMLSVNKSKNAETLLPQGAMSTMRYAVVDRSLGTDGRSVGDSAALTSTHAYGAVTSGLSSIISDGIALRHAGLFGLFIVSRQPLAAMSAANATQQVQLNFVTIVESLSAYAGTPLASNDTVPRLTINGYTTSSDVPGLAFDVGAPLLLHMYTRALSGVVVQLDDAAFDNSGGGLLLGNGVSLSVAATMPMPGTRLLRVNTLLQQYAPSTQYVQATFTVRDPKTPSATAAFRSALDRLRNAPRRHYYLQAEILLWLIFVFCLCLCFLCFLNIAIGIMHHCNEI